jgi:glycosyltransferase involved in cell wall biosynthesis
MTRVLMTFYRPEWVNSELVAAIDEHFPVRTRTVHWRPGKPGREVALISKRELLLMELLLFVRHLCTPTLYRPEWQFVCYEGHYGTLLFTRLLRVFGRRRRTVLLNFFLHDLGRNPAIRRVLALLLTPDVHVLAATRADADYFREFLPPENVVYAPYGQGDSIYVSLDDVRPGDYVFSGGFTNRDHDAVLRCAARLPDIPFVIVASKQSKITEQVPGNVELRRDEPFAEFDRLLAGSRLVVVSLKEDVGSSGQMVLLKAMSLGKATLVPEVGALIDYVEAGTSGLVYTFGDDDSFARALSDAYRDPDRLARVGAAALATYKASFTPESYRRRVVAHLST